uniref:C-type lectin domain-containing protein n=1 Tax=Panagrolaimus davidi TaxID=227884 RepID=A0A914PBD7_9BILA
MLDNVLISEYAVATFNNNSKNDFWIGANDLISKGKWSWLDNTPFDFTDWDKGEPQNISGANCGAIKMQEGLWTAADCFVQKPFVCAFSGTSTNLPTTQKPAPQTTTIKPKSCPDTWSYYNFTNSCYKVFLSQTWLEAETRCIIDKAHLASIHSREEDVFVATLSSPYSNSTNWWNGQTWVGFFTEDNNKEWHWTDGTPFDYFHWAAAYNPDNPGVENCGQIWSGALTQAAINEGYTFGDFNNYVCKDVVANFVCKIYLN